MNPWPAHPPRGGDEIEEAGGGEGEERGDGDHVKVDFGRRLGRRRLFILANVAIFSALFRTPLTPAAPVIKLVD